MSRKYVKGQVVLPHAIGPGAGESVGSTTNVYYFTPFYIEDTVTFDGITAYITNNMGAGSKWKLTFGVWGADKYRRPGKLLSTLMRDTEITLTSTEIAAHELGMLGCHFTVSPGVYFIGSRYKSTETAELISGQVAQWPEWNTITNNITSADILPERFYYPSSDDPVSFENTSLVGSHNVWREQGYSPLIGLRVA